MHTFNLLGDGELPVGFAYPRQFIRVLDLGLTNLEPWYIIEGDALRSKFWGLRERYPSRMVVPFACRQDNDDVACWDCQRDQAVVIIHDFASPGWEQRKQFTTFWDWFRHAVEAMIEFDD